MAVIQARMSSSRLPGKTLADIGGEPSLALLLRRVRGARRLAQIVVATSSETIDDPIEELAASLGAAVARGPRDDVLARFLLAIGECSGPVVRLTGDCPLIDPLVIDATVELYLTTGGCSYASNVDPRSFPDGLDVEVVQADALRAIASEPLSPAEREHVTVAIRAQPERFHAARLINPEDLGSLRWTIDETDDLEFVHALVERLGARRYEAGMDEILAEIRRAPSLECFGGVRRG